MIHIRGIEDELYNLIRQGAKSEIEVDIIDGSNIKLNNGDIVSFANRKNHNRFASKCVKVKCMIDDTRASIQISKPEMEVVYPICTPEDKPEEVIVIVLIDNTKLVLCRNSMSKWELPRKRIMQGAARQNAKNMLEEEMCIGEVDELYKIADYKVIDIETEEKIVYGSIYVAHIKELINSEKYEFIAYDLKNPKEVEVFDKKFNLRYTEYSVNFLPVFLRMIQHYELEYRGEDIDIIESCTSFDKRILSYTPELLIDFSYIDANDFEYLITNGSVNMYEIANKIKKNKHNYNEVKKILNNYNVFELEEWVEETDQKNIETDESTFIASMLFPQSENEKYILKLKCVNEDERLIGQFNSYFELYQYINKTRVREELSMNDGKRKVWNIGRVLPDNKLVAHWILSMDNELLFFEYYENSKDVFANYEIGDVFYETAQPNIYYSLCWYDS